MYDLYGQRPPQHTELQEFRAKQSVPYTFYELCNSIHLLLMQELDTVRRLCSLFMDRVALRQSLVSMEWCEPLHNAPITNRHGGRDG